jgi:hypothetical protein
VIKFWLALILGTISISAGLTYLKLHKGAQTISYPPPAPKTQPAIIDFIATSPNNDDVRMDISANMVTFQVKETKADKESEVSFKIHNSGEGTLNMDLERSSSDSARIFFDDKQLTLTDHNVKIAPGKTAVVKWLYKAKVETGKKGGEKTKITSVFQHNDARYSDKLYFEIETTVK